MYLDRYKNNLLLLCKKHNVKTLYAFGSVLTERFGNDSDVDMIVDFKRMPLKVYSDNYYSFKFSLEDMLSRPVDLIEYKAIRNPFFLENINKHKKLIYGNRNKSVVV